MANLLKPALVKIDLHTHSTVSPDGSLEEQHYLKMLDRGLDIIAITDHNTTKFARKLRDQLGDRIIVGEEVTTRDGEIIGLYIDADVSPGQSARDTAKQIKAQGGLVYIPHPFETVRKGLRFEVLDGIADLVDIVEVKNGRAIFQNKSAQAQDWASKQNKPGAASSDSHGWHGWGKTFTLLGEAPTRQTLAKLLNQATYQVGSPGIRGMLYPKFNRIRRKRS